MPLNLNSGPPQKDFFNLTSSGYFDLPPPPGAPGNVVSNFFNQMDIQLVVIKDKPINRIAGWILDSFSHYWTSTEIDKTSSDVSNRLDTLALISKELHPSAIEQTKARVCPLQFVNAVEAVEEGHLDVLRRCLAEGVNFQCPMEPSLVEVDGKIVSVAEFLLGRAIECRRVDIVRFLVEEAGLNLDMLILRPGERLGFESFYEHYPHGILLENSWRGMFQNWIYRARYGRGLQTHPALALTMLLEASRRGPGIVEVLEYLYSSGKLAEGLKNFPHAGEYIVIQAAYNGNVPVLEWVNSKPELRHLITGLSLPEVRGDTPLHSVFREGGRIDERYPVYAFYRRIHLDRLRDAEGKLVTDICPDLLEYHAAQLEQARIQPVADLPRLEGNVADRAVLPAMTPPEYNLYDEILTALATQNIVSLGWNQQHLEQLGARVDHIHPFVFFETLFENPHLRNRFTTMQSRLGGVVGVQYKAKLLEKLRDLFRNDQLEPYVAGFAENTQLDEQAIRTFLGNNDLEGLLDSIIQNLQRV